MTTITTITTLDELLDTLTTCPGCSAGDDETAHTCGNLDWTALPTFGGEEPSDTGGIWSWDATRLLVGSCASDLRIVYRPLRVWSEGDQPEVSTDDTSPRDAAEWYVSGQEWEADEGDAPRRYTVTVALESDPSQRWTYEAEIAPSGRGRLVSRA